MGLTKHGWGTVAKAAAGAKAGAAAAGAKAGAFRLAATKPQPQPQPPCYWSMRSGIGGQVESRGTESVLCSGDARSTYFITGGRVGYPGSGLSSKTPRVSDEVHRRADRVVGGFSVLRGLFSCLWSGSQPLGLDAGAQTRSGSPWVPFLVS